MKKLIAIFIMLASVAVAGDRYIIIAMRDDSSTSDKIKVRDKIKELPNPSGGNWHNVERMADMPQWRTSSNTNITWRVLCLDREKPNSTWAKIPWTKDQYEAWKDSNLDAPNKVQVRSSDNPDQTLRDAGLEPVK